MENSSDTIMISKEQSFFSKTFDLNSLNNLNRSLIQYLKAEYYQGLWERLMESCCLMEFLFGVIKIFRNSGNVYITL